jgi:hypothetical protein
MAHILLKLLNVKGARMMNHLPNLKIEKLYKELEDIESAITDNCNAMTNANIRALVDKRRHLLALLTREFIAQKQNTKNLPPSFYKSAPEIESFIKTWCSQVKTLKIQNPSFTCSEFCNLLLDHTLPEIWNFDEDLIIIDQPPTATVLEAIHQRNQKHIIILGRKSPIPQDVIAYAMLNEIKLCVSFAHLQQTISLLQISAQQVISISCEMDPEINFNAKAAIEDAVTAGKRIRSQNTITSSKFGKHWAINLLKNTPELSKLKNLHQLEISGVDDAIIVGAGPSLNKNIDQLKEIQSSVFIVTALRSLPVLDAAGIEADLVIQLDAENDDVAQKLTPNLSRPIKNLLLEAHINNGFFAIPAQNRIWSLPKQFPEFHKKFGTLPTPFSASSVSMYGLYLCQFLNFKNICLIGQDLAASSNRVYADGATNLLPSHANTAMFNIEVPGFFGNTVLTADHYLFQIERFSQIARHWASQQLNMNLVNATEGGAYIPEFDHITLDAFIGQRQIRDKNTIKSINFSADNFVTSSGAGSYLTDICDTMTKISKIAETIIKLDKQSEKTRGLDKKIKKTIERFQCLNNSTDLLQMAMQERIAKIIGTSNSVETVGTYTQFFEQIRETALILRDVAKH